MKHKKAISKVISFALAITLALTSFPLDAFAMNENGLDNLEPTSKEDQQTTDNFGEVIKQADTTSRAAILWYDFKFQNSESTIVPNVANGGWGQGEIKNYDKKGAKIIDVNIYGTDKKAISLPGGEGGGYVKFPDKILENITDITVSCWTRMTVVGGYQYIWCFGSNSSEYMYLITDGGNQGALGYTTAMTNKGWSAEETVSKVESLAMNKWILSTVTYNSTNKTLALYEDGKLIGEKKDITVKLADFKNCTNSSIGYGQFGNDPIGADIADFKIYDYAMSADEVAKLFDVPDNDRLEAEKEALSLGDTSNVTENIDLQTKGVYGSDISWESSDPSIITTAGEITRPVAGNKDAQITLTANILYNGQSVTKEFLVIVKAMPTNKQILDMDKEALILENVNAVSTDLILPTTGLNGSNISWETKNEKYLKADGKITRPSVGNDAVNVQLIAHLSYGGEMDEKEFTVTILPEIYVPAIQSVETVSVETQIGIAPSLPSIVKVVYTDGSNDKLKVVWDIPKPEKYQSEGSFQVQGTIVDTTVKVNATVTVTNKVVKPDVKAEQFSLGDVTLVGDTIFSQNRDRTLAYLKLLDNDRMLYNFRKTFNQDTKGAQPLSGWDEPAGLLRGHSTGHYVSALSLAYGSTKDPEIKSKLDEMITEMRKLQKLSKGDPAAFTTNCTPKDAAQAKWSKDPSTWGVGFISAYSPDQFALLEQYTPYATIWAPYYTLHKIIAGFIDSYKYAGSEEGLEAAKELGSWVAQRLASLTPEQRKKMWEMYIAGEYGGMNESLAELYNLTGEQKYMDAAAMFDNTTFFDGLSKNQDTIQNKHANQHIPQIVGAVAEYEATDNPYYYNLAKYFWEMVTSSYAYSIGGVGRGEKFMTANQLASNIDSDKNCETCAAYNMLKLTKDLYAYEPDNASLMDYYERTLLNQVIASQNQETTDTQHNGVTYMLPIGPGARKSYGGDYDSFTCCHGTGMENHVKYQEAAYFKSSDSLFVNLYIPSEVNWQEKGISVRQEGGYLTQNSQFKIYGSAQFKLKLRVPYWATEGFVVKINGKVVESNPETSTYVTIERTWNSGDVVEVSLPYNLHLDKTPDKLEGSTVASLMYGPFVMVAKDSYKYWKTLTLTPDLKDSVSIDTKGEKPSLTTNGLEFEPMYAAYNYAYHTYFKINTLGGGEEPSAWYMVNILPMDHGTVTVNRKKVPAGGSTTLIPVPEEGYKFTTLKINGESVKLDENGEYKVQNVQSDINIEAIFDKVSSGDTSSSGDSGNVMVDVKGDIETRSETSSKIDSYGNKVEKTITTKKDKTTGKVLSTTVETKVEDKVNKAVIESKMEKDGDNQVSNITSTVTLAQTKSETKGNNTTLFTAVSKDVMTSGLESITKNYDIDTSKLKKPIQVSFVLPNKSMETQILDKKNIRLNIVIPQQIFEADNIEIGAITLDKEIIKAAKKYATDLNIVILNDNEKEAYSWSFNGSKLAKSTIAITDINLALNVSDVKDTKDIKTMIKSGTNKGKGLVVEFKHNTNLPVKGEVKVNITSIKGYEKTKKLYLYYVNSKSKKLDELVNNEYKVSENGYVVIGINHCSNYVLVPQKESGKIVTSILSKIKVPKTVTVINAKKKKLAVTNAVSGVKVAYSIGNKTIASINKAGTITGKKPGTTIITAKFSVNGKTKTVKSKLIVTK